MSSRLVLLATLVVSVMCGQVHRKATQRQAKCSANDISAGIFGRTYKCVDGKFVLDAKQTADAQKVLDGIEARRKALVWALQTRLLTDAEMKEVERQGMYILVPLNGVFMGGDIQREFNELIYQQFRLRVLASNPCDRSNTRFTSDPVRSGK